MDNNVLTALVLAALDDSAIKALNERVNELAELGFKPQIVTELPEEGNDHTLYLVLESEPGEDPWYQEYLWLDNEWEKIGTTSIDFENYYTKDEVDSTFVPQVSEENGHTGTIVNDSNGVIVQFETQDGNDESADGIMLLGGNIDMGSASTVDDQHSEVHIQMDGVSANVNIEAVGDNGGQIHLNTRDGNDTAGVDIETNNIELYTDDTSIILDNEAGTITLDAPNGVKVSSTPVEDDDISTKGYVDDEISSLSEALSGDIDNLEQALSDEVSAREQAIQDEADARAADVTALQESIDELSGTLDDDIQELEDLIDTKADKDRFFDGRSEDWDEKTTKQKQDIWLGMVEDYVQLDIAETYDINSTLGLDPQETIVSDLYEDEAIDLTNQIIGGSF